MRLRVPITGHAVLVYRRPDGSFGWTRTLRNGVTVQGCDWLLTTGFLGGTVPAAIYGGLIDGSGFTAVSGSDTHMSHPGWSEYAALDSLTRPLWTPLPANGGLLGTQVPARFIFSADGSVKGAFLTTVADVGSVAAGTLYNTVEAATAFDVEAGGQLDVSFAVRLGA
mgnify:CR=1 FL=1